MYGMFFIIPRGAVSIRSQETSEEEDNIGETQKFDKRDSICSYYEIGPIHSGIILRAITTSHSAPAIIKIQYNEPTPNAPST